MYPRHREEFSDARPEEVSGPPQVIDYGHGQSEDTQESMDYGEQDNYNRDRDYGSMYSILVASIQIY